MCKFARFVTSYRLKSPVVLQGRIPFDNYVYLFELAEDLFNAQLYDHAQAWCSFLVHHLLPSVDTIRQDALFSLATLESNDLILLTRGSLILSEIARLKGHLDLATHHSMRVIRCYQLLSRRQNVPFFDPKHNVALISRLRILLTIPPTPPDYATAEMHRQQMIEDLTAFLEDVKMHNETISLEDLSSHVSAMPFNMAHQGLNDASLQHVLHKVLTTICPELVYVSPHLTSNDTDGDVYVFTIDRRLPYHTNIVVNTTDLLSPTFHYDADTILHMHHDSITRILSEHLQEKTIRLPDNIHTIRKVLDVTQLDMLVFTDVGMDFSTYQLAFGRFAPYQAAWWGHPITPSLPSIDYFITLVDEIPTADAHYSEQIVRMENINVVPLSSPHSTRLSKVTSNFYSMYCTSNSTSNTSDNSQLPQHDAEALGDLNALSSLGFPVNSGLVVVLGRLFKLHPEFDELLVTLLLDLYVRDHRSIDTNESSNDTSTTYVVLIAENVYELNTIILERLIKTIDARIASTHTLSQTSATKLVAKYIRLVGYNHYYTVLRSAKVVLDTNPYGGCLTSHDALSHHVPIVTLPSDYIRGRFTLGMYRNMNMSSLVAKDSAEFNHIVMKLLNDEAYWLQEATEIKVKFARLVATNNEKVAQEWAEFFIRVLAS
eukprot:gene14902-17096_t